jgi:DNA-binding SARP family transcriptional activator/tetratricopeptide (TPR) repeat protein
MSVPGSPRLEIRVLGPLRVHLDGRPLVVDTRKALAILVVLAVEQRPFARDELAAMLWPESDEGAAHGALRRTLSVLRSALGGRWLQVDRARVGLERQGVWLDLAVLDAAASGDVGSLREAADLADGPFLAGFSLRDSPAFDDWRAVRSTAVERTVAGVLDRLVAAAEMHGDLAGAVSAAARRTDLDPLDEHAHQRLMSLLARSGDRAGAIRQYRACVAVLERELGVAPLAETTRLYETIRDARPESGFRARLPDRTPTDSAPTPARLPLVGRDRELAAIRGTWAGLDRDGVVVSVVGEAGIGKTRLAQEVVDRVSVAGGRCLVARAFASERDIAYGPIVDLLRSGLGTAEGMARLRGLAAATINELERLVALPDELARLAPRMGARTREADVPAARARLLDAIEAALLALVAGPVPGLIAVEDMQWADDASREAILHAARRLSDRPVLLLLTWRPEDLDERGRAFAVEMDRLPGAGAVALARLGRADVERLATAAPWPGGAEAVLEESEGLPLYIAEAVAAGPSGMRAGIPRGVRALLGERLAGVGETAGQVVAAAAVIGRSFDLATLRRTSGRSEDETITAIEELVRRGIVRELASAPADTFDFSHAKLRDAAYEGTSLARRRLLHRRTAEALRVGPGAHDAAARLALVAQHERAAGRDAEAAAAFREAGARFREVYAVREALGHLETALALGYPDVAGLQVEIGELRTALGDYAGAIGALEAAAALTDDAGLAGVELRLGRVHARRGDLATAASHLDAALDGAATARQDGLAARILVERSVVALRAGDRDRSAATARDALARAAAAADSSAQGAAHRVLGLIAREQGDLDAARASLVRSLELASADPDPGAAIASNNALALVEAAAGDRASAIARLEVALAACRRTEELHLEAAVENNLADLLHAGGQAEAAMDHLKRAVALFAEVGGRPGELEPEIWKLVAW